MELIKSGLKTVLGVALLIQDRLLDKTDLVERR
jgi:hypothetical protein